MTKRTYLAVAILLLIVIGIGVYLVIRPDRNKPQSSAPKSPYVALGDSVAAGQGLGTALDSSACNRTIESYPSQLATEDSYQLKSVACSGATIEQGITGSQTVNGALLPPQIEALNSNTNIVTVTIGANDVGWAQVITNCYLGSCGGEQQTALNAQKLAGLGKNLDNMFSTMKPKLASKTKVYVTGYYQVFPESNAGCATGSGLSDAALEWLHQQTDLLNSSIQKSVETAGFATYVPINFTGHEVCSQEPWIQSLQSAAPFHPTEDGQKAISNAIKQRITY